MVSEQTARSILVVEDNENDVTRIIAALRGLPYDVSVAGSGEAALALCARQPPDLIVLDILLPDMDGYEVCRRLRLQKQLVTVPILFYSVVQQLDERLLGLEMGASDFLHKHADPRELVVRISNLLAARNRFDEMVRLSFTDALTELHNRLYFHHRLADEFKRSRRHQSSFSFTICDVDNFKVINDTCGHIAGDRALKVVAELLREHLRDSDIICRFGGDEFAWLMPETDLSGAFIAAERVRRAVRGAAERLTPMHLPVTVSCGVSMFSKQTAVPDEVIAAADTALYKAKQAGRDQTRTAASA